MPELKDMQFEYKMEKYTENRRSLRAKVTNYLLKTVKSIEQVVNDPTKAKKMQLFSYHDTNLIELTTALGIDLKGRNPPYASTLVFEVWQEDSPSEPYFVRTLYNDEVAIKGKTEWGGVPLNEWKAMVRQIIMSEEELMDYCGVDSKKAEELTEMWKAVI